MYLLIQSIIYYILKFNSTQTTDNTYFK